MTTTRKVTGRVHCVSIPMPHVRFEMVYTGWQTRRERGLRRVLSFYTVPADCLRLREFERILR